MDTSSLFATQPTTILQEPSLSSVSADKMLSILPFLPERGYVGTVTDRRIFISLARSVPHRPAYLVRGVDPRRKTSQQQIYSYYTVITNADSFQQAKEQALTTYYKLHRRYPEIHFMARFPTRLD